MPNRDIRTRLIIDGEKEYREALSNIAREQRVLDSEMKAAKSAFSENQNSVKALRVQNELLNKQIDQQRELVKSLTQAVQDASEKYGDADARTDGYRIKLNNAQAALNDMEAALKKNTLAIKSMAEAADNLKKAGEKIEGVGDSLTRGLTVPITAAAAATGVYIKKTLDWADALQQQADKTGISTERIQELTYAGAQLDVEIGDIIDAQGKLIRAMDNAAKGVKDQREAFDRLGISVKDSNGKLRDSNQVFEEVIGALGDMEDATERDSLTLRIFGRSAMELNPLIKAGSQELANLTAEARKNGAVMSGEAVRALDEFGDELSAMKLTVNTAASEIAVEMLPMLRELAATFKEKGIPALKDFLKDAGDLLKWFMNLPPEGQKTILMLIATGVAIGPVVSGTGKLVSGVGNLVGMFGKLSSAVSKAGGVIAILTSPAGIVIGAIAAIAALGVAIAELNGKFDEGVRKAEEFGNELEDNLEAYDDSTRGINSNADAMQTLVDRLYELEGQAGKTNVEKAEMQSIVEQLNREYPELNLAISKETGLLNTQKRAIDDIIKAQRTELLLQASQEKWVEIYGKIQKATDEKAKAVERVAKAQEAYNDAVAAQGEIGAVMATGELQAAQAELKKWTDNLDEATAAAQRLEAEQQQLAHEVYNSSTQISTAVRITTQEQAMAYAKWTELQRTAGEATRQWTQEEIAAYQEYNSQLESMTQTHLDQMGSYTDEHLDRVDISAKELTKRLKTRNKEFEDWQQGIKKLAGKIPDDVLAELEKMGPGYDKVVDGLVAAAEGKKGSGGQKTIDDFVSAMQEKSANAKDAALTEMDLLIDGIDGKQKDMLESGKLLAEGLKSGLFGDENDKNSLASALKIGGENAGQGLADGIRSKISAIKKAAADAAEAARLSVMFTIEARSPSRVTERLGAFFSEGFIQGITSRLGGIRHAASLMSNAAMPVLSMPAIPSLNIGNAAFSGASAGGAQTINRNIYVTVQPANYTVRSDMDIRAITRGIADEVSAKLRALGE